MMEKMGWQIGKGLGINEQGITHHINVVSKNDRACIGYKKLDPTHIILAQYEGLLNILNHKVNDPPRAKNPQIKKDPVTGLMLINKGSSKDYFARKTEERNNKLNKVHTSHDVEDNLENEEKQGECLHYEEKENISFDNFSEKETDSDSEHQTLRPKKKPKKFEDGSLRDPNNNMNIKNKNVKKYRAERKLKSVVVATEGFLRYINQRK